MTEPIAPVHAQRTRIVALCLVYVLTFIGFLPMAGFFYFNPLTFWYFPLGVAFLVSDQGLRPLQSSTSIPSGSVALAIWLCLLAMSIAIVRSPRRVLVRSLFLILTLVLLLALVGWYYQLVTHIT